MAEGTAGSRLTIALWFVAAVLAWSAVGIRYYRDNELSWAWAAAGLFCLLMGLSAWRRGRAPNSGPAPRDRESAP
jgi:uncharacterized membrane protein YhaH (DUF805 family)